jgi:hypothetical protein
MALEYAICDYEENLRWYIGNRELYKDDTSINRAINEAEIKSARRHLNAVQRVQDKLLSKIL